MATRVSEADRVERRLPAAMTARPPDDAAYAEALNDAIALLAEAADAGAAGPHIAPFRVNALLAWRTERGVDPDDARADYAADLARTRPDEVITWPPGRNASCWCGSSRKYKKCCGSPKAGRHD